MGEPSVLADLTGRPGLLEPDPLRLKAPERGDALLKHDPEFVAMDAGISQIRDVVNLGIDALNSLGAGLSRLPEGSLEELIIMPLVGDYLAIRQNAEATHQVRDALTTYSGNVVRLGIAVDPRWGGKAATAYLARLGVHAAAARGAGELIAQGSVVFDEIARFSEEMAIKVEGMVVDLVQIGTRLVAKLLTRLLGPAGWAAFVAEFAVRGFETVTDIIDDIQRVLEIIDQLLALKGDVTAWVEEQKARLEFLLDLVDEFL